VFSSESGECITTLSSVAHIFTRLCVSLAVTCSMLSDPQSHLDRVSLSLPLSLSLPPSLSLSLYIYVCILFLHSRDTMRVFLTVQPWMNMEHDEPLAPHVAPPLDVSRPALVLLRSGVERSLDARLGGKFERNYPACPYPSLLSLYRSLLTAAAEGHDAPDDHGGLWLQASGYRKVSHGASFTTSSLSHTMSLNRHLSACL
jgi:hypothetical protein